MNHAFWMCPMVRDDDVWEVYKQNPELVTCPECLRFTAEDKHHFKVPPRYGTWMRIRLVDLLEDGPGAEYIVRERAYFGRK